ncbi:MAG: AEC family transporter [Gammaproteobacteria bacterium]|nr:AEC family transporter [Gammaproteobacteria bacterium]
MLALRILEIIFPLLAIGGVGFLYGRRHKPEMDVANRLNLEIFVPALIFSALSDQTFDLGTYVPLALAATAVVLLSGLVAWPVARLAGYRIKTFVPPMMFCNSGNMGLPLSVLAFGQAALPAALVVFLVENVLHFTVGIWMLDHRARLTAVFRQPIVLAAALALVFSFTGTTLHPTLALPIEMLGQISIPLMLFSLGVRLSTADLAEWRIGTVAAVAAPVIGVALALPLVALLGLEGFYAGVLLLFGALPPAVLNFMLAEKYRQEPEKVASIVIIGNLLAIAAIPLVLAYVLPRYG